MKILSLPTLILFITLAACSKEGGHRGTCDDDNPCPKDYLCYQGMCLHAQGDPDWDGLTTEVELRIGSNPLSWDTDNDGIPDGDEFGPGPEPLDTDGDGIPDILESMIEDSDGDCIPDQLDPTDGFNEQDYIFARDYICPRLGYCAEIFQHLIVVCIDGTLHCAFPDGTLIPRAESLCDGIDENCDGFTDEGLLFMGRGLGEPCLMPGICGSGTVECGPAGMVICSSGPGGSEDYSRSELCNGLDDDCDGLTDEDFLLDGLRVGQVCYPPGECPAGVVECLPSQDAVVCSTGPGGSQYRGRPEICDGLDNDCNGLTDEDLVREPFACPAHGVCASHPEFFESRCIGGTWVCVAREGGPFEGPEEKSCDGIDNNCDGLTDESFSILDFDLSIKRVGESCGTGACAGGTVVCTQDGKGAYCSTAHLAAEEICDGIDNNCNGLTDEGIFLGGLMVGEVCEGRGVCGKGVVECGPEGKAVCSSNPEGSNSQAQIEICDGLDNNCNGQTDEDLLPPQGIECPMEGVCRDAQNPLLSCEKGRWRCLYPSIPGFEPQEQTCDGLDNDCNGWTDEGLPMVFTPGPMNHGRELPIMDVYHHASAMAPEGLLVIGGRKVAPPDSRLFSDGLFLYSQGRWKLLARNSLFAREYASMCIPYSGKWQGGIVLVGGKGADGRIASPLLIRKENNYQPQVIGLSSLVSRRWGHGVFCSRDGNIHAIGGFDADGRPSPAVTYYPTFDMVGPGSSELPLGMLGIAVCPGGEDALLYGKGASSSCRMSLITDRGNLESRPVDFCQDIPGLVFEAFCSARYFIAIGRHTPPQAQGLTLLRERWIEDEDDRYFVLPPFEEPWFWEEEDEIQLAGGLIEDRVVVEARKFDQNENWSEPDLLPPPLAGAGISTMEEKTICLYGGYQRTRPEKTWSNDLWCQDEQGKWSITAVTGGPSRAYHSLNYIKNRQKFLITGGQQPGEEQEPFFEKTGMFWLSLTGEVEDISYLCPPGEVVCSLAGHASAVRTQDSSVWIFGGRVKGIRNDKMWRFSPSTGQWTVFTPGIQGRFGASMFSVGATGEEFILAGGESDGDNMVWRFHPANGALRASEDFPWFNHAKGCVLFDHQDYNLLLFSRDRAASLRGPNLSLEATFTLGSWQASESPCLLSGPSRTAHFLLDSKATEGMSRAFVTERKICK